MIYFNLYPNNDNNNYTRQYVSEFKFKNLVNSLMTQTLIQYIQLSQYPEEELMDILDDANTSKNLKTIANDLLGKVRKGELWKSKYKFLFSKKVLTVFRKDDIIKMWLMNHTEKIQMANEPERGILWIIM